MPRRYKDNAYNRSVGRVGQPLGSHVISRGSSSGSSYCSNSSAVYVSGYTRSNGTYVAPHTRSTPTRSASTSRCTSNSTGDSESVYVSGYVRSNGTYVAPHARSTPSRSRSTGDRVNVSGYTNSEGTSEEAPHTRSTPSRSSSGFTLRNTFNVLSRLYDTYVAPHTRPAPSHNSSSRSTSDRVNVSGYTKSDGTHVAPHTRSAPGHDSSRRSTSDRVNVTNSDSTRVAPYTRSACAPSHDSSSSTSDVVHVSGYTRSDGTYVAPYTRSKQGASASSSCAAVVEPRTRSVSTSNTASRVYVDNAYNRKLGRVGKPIGTHVVSRTNKSDAVRYYSDNPDNRRLDRVGKPIPMSGYRSQKIIQNYTITEVKVILEGLAISDAPWQDYQYTHDYLQQQEVEESWRWSGIKLSTDVLYLNGRASHNHSQFKLIPYQELELKQEIGRGGFGVVVAGLWHNTAIAFKRLHYSRMSKNQLKSFLSEVTILSSLDHPNTVKLFGAVADTENSCVGFVMEYLRRSLFKAIFIDDCEFTDDKKKDIVGQIAAALVYLHDDKKIAHCDIKSENILLDSNDKVKLADFGLSTVKSATEMTQSALQAGQGTPRYSAPEVLRGELLSKSQLFPTDMYSLAIVVFELIVEEEPFDGLSLRQLERHVGNGDLCPTSENTEIDDLVKAVLYKCWDRVASNRPTAREFQEIWATIHCNPSIGLSYVLL